MTASSSKRLAFISGGTSGIGLAMAQELGNGGARVVLQGRSGERGAVAVESLQSRGIDATFVQSDVREVDAVRSCIESLDAPIDVLVLAAAGNFPAKAETLSPRGFKAVVDIDLIGAFHVCRLAFEHLRRPGAHILAVSAPQARQVMPQQVHVAAAKAGLEQMVRTLAREWGPQGVRVNAIVPGVIDGTEGVRRLLPDAKAKSRLAQSLPAQRLGTLEDIAALTGFLCSPAASYVTGAIVPCDGGLSVLSGPAFGG